MSIPELTGELHYAIIGFLARTPSVLWLVNQEDMTKEPAQQNLPGTTAEYPNWSRKMGWSIKDLSDLPEARDCAAMVALLDRHHGPGGDCIDCGQPARLYT